MYIRFLRHGRKEAHDERYEYDAYGNCSILEPNFSPDPDGKSDYGNPYAFQGKNLDLLDNGGLELMYWPYRYYSTYLGRWTQAEKLGMIPNDNQELNRFDVIKQYEDGPSLYEAFVSNPIVNFDPYGLFKKFICCSSCQKQVLTGDETWAQLDIMMLKLQINSALASPDKKKYPWFTGPQLRKSLKILKKASAKLKTGKVKCEKKCGGLFGPPVAWAWPGGDTVHVCKDYWDYNTNARSATLVHEGTHLGSGTLDAAYFWQNNQAPHNVLGIIGWDIIASTYDTWILTGFCVPGYNCPKKVKYNPSGGGSVCPDC